jgi:hypothetical protein
MEFALLMKDLRVEEQQARQTCRRIGLRGGHAETPTLMALIALHFEQRPCWLPDSEALLLLRYRQDAATQASSCAA